MVKRMYSIISVVCTQNHVLLQNVHSDLSNLFVTLSWDGLSSGDTRSMMWCPWGTVYPGMKCPEFIGGTQYPATPVPYLVARLAKLV